MFEKKCLVFYNCTTPLHMGAGTALGAIDNPIQREVHTNHPQINGTGIKGAVRHHLNQSWGEQKKTKIAELFGADTNDKDLFAGAISFTDANLVAFPVRSIKNTFIYATSPYALARLKRTAEAAGLKTGWSVPALEKGNALGASAEALDGGRLCLETYEFAAAADDSTKAIAAWLAERCMPDNTEMIYFKEKIKKDLFVLCEDDFNYFVKNATVVEPHVRIDDDTGTAADGALFYTENLPPESILAGITLGSIERTIGKNVEQRRKAEDALKLLLEGETGSEGINGKIVQMGGDATTGRGLVLVNSVKEK